jgi:Uma2 family endonuclease
LEDKEMNAPLMHPALRNHDVGLRLDAGANGMCLTPEEFEAVSDWDENYRYELIQGVVVVNPAVSTGEADPNDDLGYLLRKYQETHPQGHFLDLTVYERDVRVGNNIRRCDRAIWTGLGRDPDVHRDIPSIVIEFVSAGRRNFLRDFVDKRREYLAAGVLEYWVINRFSGSMHVFFPPGGLVAERVVEESETYCTPLLPGFELPLARILAKGVRWDKPKNR